MVQNYPIAALYYKAIVSTVEVETKGSVTYIRKNLMNLKTKLEMLNFNITEFHEYVNDQMTSLASHGKTSEDLIMYLFSAYDIVPDVNFKATLARKQDDYNMGVSELSYEQLMSYAQNAYDTRIQDQDKPWLTKSKELQEVEALTATVKELTRNNQKLTKAMKERASIQANKGQKRNKNGRRANTGKFAWKDVPPKPNEDTTKVVNSKTYHWCEHHNQWTLHKPSECRLNNNEANESETIEDQEETNSIEDQDSTTETNAMSALAAATLMDF